MSWRIGRIFSARLILLLVPSSLRVKLMIVKVSSLAGTEESEERALPEMLVRIPVTTPDDQKS
jgi:hypothetical protein